MTDVQAPPYLVYDEDWQDLMDVLEAFKNDLRDAGLIEKLLYIEELVDEIVSYQSSVGFVEMENFIEWESGEEIDEALLQLSTDKDKQN